MGVQCIVYDGCGVCKVKVESVDGVFGECRKCEILIKMTNCQKFYTATVHINDNKITQLIDKLIASLTYKKNLSYY